jgi:hypothetical protein
MHKIPQANLKKIRFCPYCYGTDFVKSGFRVKKFEKIQIFYCNHCQKKFTPLVTRGKTYPVSIILQSLIQFNKFIEPEQIALWLNEKYDFKITPQTIANWIKEYERLIPFKRMREYLMKKLKDGQLNLKEMIAEQRFFHQQIYDFKYHRFKTDLLLAQDFKNYQQKEIKDFLELVIAECPHQIFKESKYRASEFEGIFNPDGVRIIRKKNRANEIANFVMQAVANNKERHRALQEFILFCDSTTIAVEVPVVLDKEDIDHFKVMLGFDVPIDIKDGEVVTGHIDILQLRNGIVHIIDFKPSAAKAKPIDQLTIYALALSRLTGLRLHSFKCAWFDEEDYFEFFPLHIVYKKHKGKNKLKVSK